MPRARRPRTPAPTGAPVPASTATPAPPAPTQADEEFDSITGSASRSFRSAMLASLLDVAGIPARTSAEIQERRVGAMLAAMRGFGPRDEVEGMLAAQAVALHHAGMAALRRATHGDLPAETTSRLRRDGAAMFGKMASMVETIEARRGNTVSQRVVVEHVTVQAGGQAIVGAVAPGVPCAGGRGPHE